jgi:hypothetical protein
MSRLVKREKKKFGADPRAVGNYWVNWKNGELVFGCDARLNIENLRIEGVKH